MRRSTVALALCLAPSAFATQQCGSVTIRSAADAEALRKGCSTVDGTVTLSAELNESISLDGVQIITGNLTSGDCNLVANRSSSASAISILSSTLTTIHGDLNLGSCVPGGLTNISFPNLKAVDGGFDIVNFGQLTYLDITNLDSVGYFYLWAPPLQTMLHNELRNVTGAHGTKRVFVTQTSLTSVDSLFRNPLDIGDSLASVEVNYFTN
ncbi:uncharacterized protein TRIVIDRAFT_222198 [Trichoderma virens Gv29-8]|uniref:Uncharacterized protein n=1 Tax=Hypocrea virens (strain Gv29-8 / FGSC 10586) TaxID=413071 RepID=G9MS79_HYPVG|nr:uncharacterized protein TRIVIDRAFT_222198 [Trichoderma virens Gv29-8]EHK22941.1 hypothetical protein TRIVIDRAFT_222198 [Trichoderma virens Gv29-8]UKZ47991.1 hypothetical protein TrVGV298_002227 [Trichoderma virens]